MVEYFVSLLGGIFGTVMSLGNFFLFSSSNDHCPPIGNLFLSIKIFKSFLIIL